MHTKVFTIFVGLCIVFSSCSPRPKTGSAIITGKVNVNYSKTIKLASGPVTLTDSWIDRADVGDSLIDLNPDGTFRIELPMETSGFYRLSHESNEVELFLSPRDSLNIDFNSEALFSGQGEAVNKHLKSLRDLINANRRYINGMDFYQQSPARVDAILDSLQQVYLGAYQLFLNDHAVDERFEEKIMADITYRNKLYKIVHPPVYNRLTGKMLPVAENYYQEVAEGSFDNPGLLKSVDYVLFLEEYINAQAAGDLKYENYFTAPIDKIHPRYYQIQQLDADQEIVDYLLHEHLNRSMDNYGVAYLGDLMPEFRKDCRNPEFVRRIEDRYKAGIERRKEPSAIKIYKTIGNIELEAHIFYPEGHTEADQAPAYLFFHGGGWAMGMPEWGYTNCKNYSDKGMVAISFEYRLIDVHKSNILDCVRDAHSAVLWTRRQAKSLGVDPDKIVAAGFSAGGHLAAATAILDEFEASEASGLSSEPNAIVVHSASYNTLKNDWFAVQSEQNPESISTFHQLDKNLVPAIFFHGTEDHLAPITEFTEFRDKMDALGNVYDYKIFENVGHFFNNPAAREEVDQRTEAFLVKLGYIQL